MPCDTDQDRKVDTKHQYHEFLKEGILIGSYDKIWWYYKQFYCNKFENLDEIVKFLEKHFLLPFTLLV